MHVTNWSRIKGTSCLLALVVSGLFTNCTCGKADPRNGQVKPDYSKGDVAPVPGCVDPLHNFEHYVDDPALCDGSATALPGAPQGWFLPILENQMRKCPDDGMSIPTTEAFNIYWTITNVSASLALDTDITNYELHVNKVNGSGGEDTVVAFIIPQPKLASCEYQNVGFGFNNGDPARALAAGTYRFRLTGIYDDTSTPKGYLATKPIEVVIR
ncbi:MAG TPA: hypothetical protein VIV60_19040 [Polyangiaceae bacterium]